MDFTCSCRCYQQKCTIADTITLCFTNLLRYFKLRMHLPSSLNLEGVGSGGKKEVSNTNVGPCLTLTIKGRKRRHIIDSGGEADIKSTLRFSVMPNTPLTPYLLPAKRRRCLEKPRKLSMNSDPSSLDETKWKGYRNVTKVSRNKLKKQNPSLAKVERCLEYPIKKEDIYAFIHNIRLDITRSDQLSSELDLKCLLTSSG
ncbi:uncharacterized protein [Apostichopus japonicus]|uniref:uncharacterized protein n=1 Tax=Stichopus japonicus TaxID=307972 RepID=UPI003AB1B9F6